MSFSATSDCKTVNCEAPVATMILALPFSAMARRMAAAPCWAACRPISATSEAIDNFMAVFRYEFGEWRTVISPLAFQRIHRLCVVAADAQERVQIGRRSFGGSGGRSGGTIGGSRSAVPFFGSFQ